VHLSLFSLFFFFSLSLSFSLSPAKHTHTHTNHRFVAIYNELYDIEVAEDSIYPEKFKVEGYPTLDQFTAWSGEAVMSSSKDEL